MMLNFIPPNTKIYMLNSITNWWKPIIVKNENMVGEPELDPREHGRNVIGFTVYRFGGFYLAIDNDIELIHEYIPW